MLVFASISNNVDNNSNDNDNDNNSDNDRDNDCKDTYVIESAIVVIDCE